MSRIKPVDPQNVPELQAIFEAGKQLMGFIPNDGLAMAHHPEILKAFLGLVQSIYAPSEISGGLKRLIGIIVSTASGCEYCLAHASNGAFHQNEDKEKIQAVWEFQSSELFSEEEKAALEIAFKSSLQPNAVKDEDIENLSKYFSEKAKVEIMSTISLYAFLNRWNSTLKTQLEEQPKQFYQNLKSH